MAEGVKDKLHRFFSRGKSSAALSLPKPAAQGFTPGMLKEIGPDCPANHRLKTIAQLCDEVKHRRLENNAVEALWYQISDLVQPNAAPDNRQVALHFLQCLLEGQLQYMTIMRAQFFRVIKDLTVPGDLNFKVDIFSLLSEGGKNLLYFEDETGQLLVDMMQEAINAGRVARLMPIIINVIKYNAAYLDEEIVSGLVKKTCMIVIPSRTRTEEEFTYTFSFFQQCLEVMDAVICYSYLPTDSLYHFIVALCHTIENVTFAEMSWKLMRKLLGTYLGHSAIQTMCCLLQDKRQPVNPLFLRGAIFYTGMALWGSRKVTTLKYTHASVLPSFYQALVHENDVVAYEVILNVQRLVSKYGKSLQPIAWEIIMDILETLLIQIEKMGFEAKIKDTTNSVITDMEKLYNSRIFFGPTARLFKIVEMCADARPTSSVCALMDYHLQSIHPGKDDWIRDLNAFMEKFFKGHTRTEVRTKALDFLSLIVNINSLTHETDLIEKVIIPLFDNINNDPDAQVRCKAVELLLTLCEDCNSNNFFQLTPIVEKILSRPLRAVMGKDTPGMITGEPQLADILKAVTKTIEVFRSKLYMAPASHCCQLYEMLMAHIELHYKHMYLGPTACAIRKNIFDLLVLLKAHSNFRVGLSDRKPGEGNLYSPYVLCSPSENLDSMMVRSPGLAGMATSDLYSVLQYELAFKAFLGCLDMERDWTVLKTVLEKLPIILENKTLVLSAGHYVATLCGKLCALLRELAKDEKSDRHLKLINRPKNFTRSQFHSFVFPVLASMVTYHACLTNRLQRSVVECLEFGLVTKCAKICVTTLRICSLEMQDLMMRMLPKIILSLSRICATISMAIPTLAFLSSIIRIPMLYVNFVEEQYMSVFAITLSYTNPIKFSHYTVSLAHHVIGVWFICCRLPFRRNFAKYIAKGLKDQSLDPFNETPARTLYNINQNSSDRERSGSLNEGKKRPSFLPSTEGVRNDGRIPMDDKMLQFHKELGETCLDMMTRYAFGNFMATTKRTPIIEFLLKGGRRGTWVVGNKIVTITTSGSGSQSNPSGLCDKCMSSFQNYQHNQVASNATAATSSTSDKRRRHRSMASLSKSNAEGKGNLDGEETLLRRRSQDDMGLLQEHGGNASDDVGVQTGTSLSLGADFTGLDSLMSEGQEHRAFLSTQCSCWCTGWAEVHIRGASGVVSWMMRISNEPHSNNFFMDPSIPDITQLLAPVRCKSPDTESLGKIDSGSLCEEEYETLHSQHFSDSEKAVLLEEEPDSSTTVSGTDIPTAPKTPETSVEVHSPSSLRRISSSPSLTFTLPKKESAADCLKHSNDSPGVKRIEVANANTLTEAADFSSIEGKGSDRRKSGRSSTSRERERTSPDTFTMASNFSCVERKASNLDKPVRSTTSKEGEGRSVSSSSNLKKRQSQGEDEKSSSISISTGNSALEEDVFNSSQDNIPITSNSAKSNAPKVSDTPDSARRTAESSTQSSSPQKKNAHRSFSVDFAGQKKPEPLDLTASHHRVDLFPKSSECPDDGSQSSSFRDEVPELRQMKHRSHTISVMSPALESSHGEDADDQSKVPKDGKGGLNPSFVFLQLYHCHPLVKEEELPILVPNNGEFQRTVERLDHIYPYETHKIGVLYMGKGQKSEEKVILSNEFGSKRYTQFIQGLGQMISVEEAEKEKLYLGGLTKEDGKFTISWSDESMRIVFHVATLMTVRPGDQQFNIKKSHIGNDFVSIVYNDSSEPYKIGTISGQFNFVSIVIRPLDHGSNAVYLVTKEEFGTVYPDIADILGHTHTKIISDAKLPLLVRQIAVHCNLASMVLQRQQSAVGTPEVFASNWLERLRKIKLLKKRVVEYLKEKAADKAANPSRHFPHTKAQDVGEMGVEDFTDYV